MSRPLLALAAVLVTGIVALAQGSPSVRDMLAGLFSADVGERDAAGDRIVEVGADAIPVLAAEVERRRDETIALVATMARIDPSAAGQSGGATPTWWEKKVEEARRVLAAGDPYRARAIAEAVLLLEPNCEGRDVIRGLAREADSQVIRNEAVRAAIDLSASVLECGQDLLASVTLSNVSAGPVALSTAGEEPANFGLLTITRRRFAMDGSFAVDQQTAVVRLDGPVELAPGESRTLKVALPPDRELVAGQVERIEVEGGLRPYSLKEGGRTLPGFIRVEPARAVVLPKGRMGPLADPSAALAEVLAAEEPAAARLFEAAVLASDDQVGPTVDALIFALDRGLSGDAEVAAMAALGAITGEGLGMNAGAWKSWWLGR